MIAAATLLAPVVWKAFRDKTKITAIQKDDNKIEESIEDILNITMGVTVDLTPESKEDCTQKDDDGDTK